MNFSKRRRGIEETTSAASEAAASEAAAACRGGRLKFGGKSLVVGAERRGGRRDSRAHGTRFDLLASKLPEEERSPLVGFPSPSVWLYSLDEPEPLWPVRLLVRSCWRADFRVLSPGFSCLASRVETGCVSLKLLSAESELRSEELVADSVRCRCGPHGLPGRRCIGCRGVGFCWIGATSWIGFCWGGFVCAAAAATAVVAATPAGSRSSSGQRRRFTMRPLLERRPSGNGERDESESESESPPKT